MGIVLVLDKAPAPPNVTSQGVSAKINSSVIRKCSAKTHPLEDEDDEEYENDSYGPPILAPSSLFVLSTFAILLCNFRESSIR
jgi:hypothetical protein